MSSTVGHTLAGIVACGKFEQLDRFGRDIQDFLVIISSETSVDHPVPFLHVGISEKEILSFLFYFVLPIRVGSSEG